MGPTLLLLLYYNYLEYIYSKYPIFHFGSMEGIDSEKALWSRP